MKQKIESLNKLKRSLLDLLEDSDFLQQVYASNNWFTPSLVKMSVQNICDEFLDEVKLTAWLSQYNFQSTQKETIGLILAGNVPLVGFQDILCVYFSPHDLKLKLSSKDTVLTKKVVELWCDIDADWSNSVEIVSIVKDIDKIIATGSNNSNQYFEFYFKKYRNILRRNRTSVAIVPKDISDEELNGLVDDIFLFYGLGCRNISKLYLEEGFNKDRLFEVSEKYSEYFNHQKYMNNYDYQRTLLLLNTVEHFSNNFLILRENPMLFTAISVVHYEWFTDINKVKEILDASKEDIQCVVGRDEISFGNAQKPTLTDYPDHIDVMEFLVK